MDKKLLSTDRPVAIYYAFQSDVESVEIWNDNSKNVVFKVGKDWNLINTSIGSIDFQETPNPNGKYTTYDTTLVATCPGIEEETPSHIASVAGRKVLLRIDYKSGLKKLVGTMDSSPVLAFKTLSGISTSRKLQSDWDSDEPNSWLYIVL